MEEHISKNPEQHFNDPDGRFNSRQFELNYEVEEYLSKNDKPINLLDEFTIYQSQPDLATQLQRAPAARNMSSQLQTFKIYHYLL